MGSILTAIKIPVGSADAVLTGLIQSVDRVLNDLGDLASQVVGSLGS